MYSLVDISSKRKDNHAILHSLRLGKRMALSRTPNLPRKGKEKKFHEWTEARWGGNMYNQIVSHRTEGKTIQRNY